MTGPCPDGFCVTYHYKDQYDGGTSQTLDVCWKKRLLRTGGTVFNPTFDGTTLTGWAESVFDYLSSASENWESLEQWKNEWADGSSSDYFTVDPDTRNKCFSPLSSPPSFAFPGIASPPPPPPPPKDNMCCDCNTIATIVAENTAAEAKQHEATRDLIDRRTIEEVQEINKMLQGMKFNINLQPVIDRLNELEANLWNGLKAGG